MKKSVLAILTILLLFSCSSLSIIAAGTSDSPLVASWKSTTASQPWQEMAALELSKAGAAEIVINTASKGQIIDGFGGAFNEKGWAALSLLAPEKREEALKALFDPKDGAKFNICRVPIGASDYALERYTLDETKDDFAMKNFSIDRDRKYLIPYIKAAMQYRPDLKVWGSDWTPPTWMKTNSAFDGGYMKDDAKTYAAYALYLAHFVESYQAEGIRLYAVAVQNEPTIETHYPSCLWKREQFRTFVRDYMGPTFKERKVNAQIILGTFQSGDYFDHPTEVLDDKDANRYISTVGYQWDGLKCVAQTRKDYPDKTIMQTETECGNWYWKPGFDPNRPQNDWFYGSYTWKKVKDYFDAGVNSYMLWNMVLDEEGKSIDSQRPWPQDAAVVVDKNTKTVIYTPMYYAFKHFSYFVEPGAHYLKVTKSASNAIAFKNPDGKIVIELENGEAKAKTITVGIGSYRLKAALPANSFNTIVIPAIK